MVNYRRLEETRDDFSSAMARHSGDETRVYKTVGDEKLRISLYYPRDYDPARRYPLLVCVHGGGWASRKVFPDQEEWAGDYLGFLARRYADNAGRLTAALGVEEDERPRGLPFLGASIALDPSLVPPWRLAAANAAYFLPGDAALAAEGPMRADLLERLDFSPAPHYAELLGCPAEQADETSWQETGGQLADVAYTKLQTVQHSLRCRYDYAANTITAEVWQGLDRTQEQTENPFVTFSDGFGNLTEVDASSDRSNYKNYAVVAGQDQEENRKVAYADLSGGGYKRILYVDARSERWYPDEQTEAEYLAGLQQKGLDELLNYQIIQNVDIQAAASGFAYLQDWDLGDKVDVIVEDIGLAMQARIVTVREVFKQNNHTVEIELGDKKLTDIQKARLIY